MSGSGVFEDRERSFENKFAHDNEVEFKISARSSRLLAVWAAGEMGWNEEQTAEYAKEIISASLELKGEWDVVSKVVQDLVREHVKVEEDSVRAKLEDLRVIAREQIMTEDPAGETVA